MRFVLLILNEFQVIQIDVSIVILTLRSISLFIPSNTFAKNSHLPNIFPSPSSIHFAYSKLIDSPFKFIIIWIKLLEFYGILLHVWCSPWNISSWLHCQNFLNPTSIFCSYLDIRLLQNYFLVTKWSGLHHQGYQQVWRSCPPKIF